MKKLAPFLIIALAIVSEPAIGKCHVYKYWAYNFPQSCGGRHQATSVALARHRPSRPVTPVTPVTPDIPLPSLARADCVGGEADEAARARLLLRAALENAYGH